MTGGGKKKGSGGHADDLQRWPREPWTQFKPVQLVLILNRTSNILSPILLGKTPTGPADDTLLRNDRNKGSYLTNKSLFLDGVLKSMLLEHFAATSCRENKNPGSPSATTCLDESGSIRERGMLTTPEKKSIKHFLADY